MKVQMKIIMIKPFIQENGELELWTVGDPYCLWLL